MKIRQPKRNKGKRFKIHEDAKRSSQQERPLFSFEFLNHDARYALSRCSSEEKSRFIEKIVNLSQLTWAEIQSSNRHKVGYEKRYPQRRYEQNCIQKQIQNETILHLDA